MLHAGTETAGASKTPAITGNPAQDWVKKSISGFKGEKTPVSLHYQ
jgi:hypothetical protein